MATRRSGQVRISIMFLDAKNMYQVKLSTPRAKKTIYVQPPAYLKNAVDSKEGYDTAAHAALSFAADEGMDLENYADMTDSGWAIQAGR